jgi:hypothetical protein
MIKNLCGTVALTGAAGAQSFSLGVSTSAVVDYCFYAAIGASFFYSYRVALSSLLFSLLLFVIQRSNES